MTSFDLLSHSDKQTIRAIACNHPLIRELDSLYYLSSSLDERAKHDAFDIQEDESHTHRIEKDYYTVHQIFWLGSLQGDIYQIEHVQEMEDDIIKAEALNIDAFNKDYKYMPECGHAFLEFAKIINMKNQIEEKLTDKTHTQRYKI